MNELNKKLADRDNVGKFITGHTVTDANKQALREATIGRTGCEARHWKKGRYKNSKGYIMVYAGSREWTNKSGYIPEHRLVAMEFLGRKLLSSEVVHHINGIRDDNRPGNLWVYDRREHRRMHNEDAFAIIVELLELGRVGFANGRYYINQELIK